MLSSAGGARKASYADREATLEALRQGYVAGRIDLEELRNRAADAYSSGTADELAALTTDLAPGGSSPPRARHRPASTAPVRPPLRGWCLVVLLAWLGLIVAASVNSAVPVLAVLPFGLAIVVGAEMSRRRR